MANKFKRRDVLGMGGAMAVSAIGDAAAQPVSPLFSPSAPRPNIVLFMPDEMRADALACYGNPVTRTPNLDRLAAEGTRFENCHVQFSVCGASRCSLLTGWPASVRGHRSLFYFLRPEEPNLFRYLRLAGYDVFWLGKNDALAAASFPDSVTQWTEVGKGRKSRAGVDTSNPYGSTPGSFSFLFPPSGTPEGTNDYGLVQSAIDLLSRRETNRPYCIFLAMSEPHPPYSIAQRFYDLYKPGDIPPPAPPGMPNKPNFHAGIRDYYNLTALNEATFRKIRSVYYGQVSYSDWLLGLLMEAMDRTGRNRDTALFVLSDHGDYTGDYGLVEKWPSGLEDNLTHVPLIARVPGFAPAPASGEMVELYDVMATCLELAGTKANHTHFARSLVPQLSGKPGDADRAAFAEGGYNAYEPQDFEPVGYVTGLYTPKLKLQNEHPETITRTASVRTRTHKLISRPNGQSELYDCVADPQLLHNLYGQASVAAQQGELQQRLLNWYINTTGVAPMDKDSRSQPPFYPTAAKDNEADLRHLLDH